MKLDLLTNATVVDDAIRFVNKRIKKKDDNNNIESELEAENTLTTITSFNHIF